VIGDQPLLDDVRVALARWIAGYYLAPLFHALALLLPPGFQRKPVTLVRPLVAAPPAADDLTARHRELLEAVLAGAGDVENLRRRVTFRAIEPALAQLERRGLVEREFTLSRPSVGPKFAEFAALAIDPAEAERRIAATEPPKPSRRADVLDLLAEAGSAPLAAAAKLAGSHANLATRYAARSAPRTAQARVGAAQPRAGDAQVRRLGASPVNWSASQASGRPRIPCSLASIAAA
jgi:primosomal protein N'